MEKKQRTTKEKRKNMERRKEKSRDAARCRRGKEHEIFTELFSMLPVSKTENISHLDKASIIRITTSYLKIRALVEEKIPVPSSEDDKKSSTKVCEEDSLYLNALEGFLLVTTADGDIVFISENVNRFLGLSQIDVLGQSIYELSHPCDHAEIKEMLSTKDLKSPKSHFLRMKCTLTTKGRNVNMKSASYKVIQYGGRMIETNTNSRYANIKKEQEENELNDKALGDETEKGEKNSTNLSSFHFVAVGEPISHPANIEIPLGQNTFLSKHSLDMKFTYADERIVDFFGYDPNTLITKSLFDYPHAQDSILIRDCFKSLFSKGQSQTERYRFLASGGGYAWVLTQATVIYNNNTQKPQSVVCVNYVISGVENKDEIYSLCQLEDDCCDRRPACTFTTAAAAATAVAAVPALRSVHDEDDLIKAAVAAVPDGYAFERSPQRLIEKLSIDTSTTVSGSEVARSANAAAAAAVAVAAVAGAADLNDTFGFADTGDYRFAVAPKNARNIGRVLGGVSPLPGANDFLVNSISPRSSNGDSRSQGCTPWSSPDSSGSPAYPSISSSPAASCTAPHQTVWLMNDELEEKIALEVNLSAANETNENGKEATTNTVQSREDNVDIATTRNIERPNPEKIFSTSTLLTSISETPKPSTTNVFVPFTEDMNQGFMGFTDDETELKMLKEIPEDLTHLAPTPGDVCVPLDGTAPITYVYPDIYDDIMFNDGSLLSNDNNIRDEFFSYKDDLEPSSRPHSPILTQNGECDISQFCDDNSPLHETSVHHFLDFPLPTEDIDDISGKTSLLPITLDQDSLLPFVTNDFMWGSSSGESSPWSSVSNSPSSCSLSPRLDHTSSLAKLLIAEPTCNYDGGGKTGDGGGGTNVDTSVGGQRSSTVRKSVTDCGYDNKGSKQSLNTLVNHSNRDFSNHSYVKRNVFHRSNVNNNNNNSNNNGGGGGNNDGHKVRGNGKGSNVPRKDVNNRVEDKRKSISDVMVGSKRGLVENWNRGNSCKRSRQTARTAAINGTGEDRGCNSRRLLDTNGMMEAVAASVNQTNSVLMNLLVSGCDLNAGYREDGKEVIGSRTCKKRSNGTGNVNNENQTPINWPQLKKKICRLLDPGSTSIPSLMDLTEQDYAVNAPSTGELLQGCELLKALESPVVEVVDIR